MTVLRGLILVWVISITSWALAQEQANVQRPIGLKVDLGELYAGLCEDKALCGLPDFQLVISVYSKSPKMLLPVVVDVEVVDLGSLQTQHSTLLNSSVFISWDRLEGAKDLAVWKNVDDERIYLAIENPLVDQYVNGLQFRLQEDGAPLRPYSVQILGVKRVPFAEMGLEKINIKMIDQDQGEWIKKSIYTQAYLDLQIKKVMTIDSLLSENR